MTQHVYLDHAATTPVRDEVMTAMAPFFGARFGNPSSVHRWGREARVALDEARERLAATLGAHPDEICFTSGGTEGDNFAILGAARVQREIGRTTAVTTPIEHKAILASVHQIAREGGEERMIAVLHNGLVDRDDYSRCLDGRTAIASVMWVNNETGVMQDIAALAAEAKAAGVVFHTDAVQAFGKVPIDTQSLPVDLLTISGHKIGAPKGIGALFIRRSTSLENMFHGGAQDRGRRPGTENVAFAIGLAAAAELLVAEHDAECARVGVLRDRFERELRERVPDVVYHSADAPRATHISNVSIPGTNSESMLMALDMRGIACSAGSACQSGSTSASHVLHAMGVSPDLTNAALRMSFGCLSDDAAVTRVVDVLAMLTAKSRGLQTSSAPATANAPAFSV